jgi:Holliday junction resolvase RusA-like endonuclease
MSDTVHTFRIFGSPVPNKAPGSQLRTNAAGIKYIHVHPATIVEDWQKCVNLQLLGHKARQNTPMLDGALRIEIWLFLTRQRSSSLMYPERKPDFDNLVKPLLDCLEKMEIIKNDSRIVEAIVHLRWANYHYPDDPQTEQAPGVIFGISQIDTSRRKELNKRYREYLKRGGLEYETIYVGRKNKKQIVLRKVVK